MQFFYGEEHYTAPEVEILEIAVEQGFSNSIEDPVEGDDMDW